MKALDIAIKDLTRSMRNFFAVGMMVGAPLLITGLIYFAFGGMRGSSDLPGVRVGWVNLDQLPSEAPLETSLGEAIYTMFTDPSVEDWLSIEVYPDEPAVRAAVDRQEIGVAVIVPEEFSANFLAGGRESPILLVQDPTLNIGPVVVRNMIFSLLEGVAGGGIAIETVVERQMANLLEPKPEMIQALSQRYQEWYIAFQRDLFHEPEKAALQMAAPASGNQAKDPLAEMLALLMMGQMIFFAFFSGAYSMLTILTEEEEGTLPRLFTTPTDRTAILGGKFLAVFLMVILQGVFLMLFARLIFRVDWGQTGSVVMALVAQVLAATGLGVLLIAFVKSSRQGGPVLGGVLTVLGMLSGLFTVSVPNMPEAFEALAYFTPQGWVLIGWKAALAGQAPAGLLLPFAVASAIGVVMFAAGAILFRRRYQ